MNHSIEQLIKLLQQTQSLYNQLLPVIQQEKEAAIGSDVRQLTLVGNEKQCLIAQLNPLDQQLTHLMQNFAKQFSIPLGKLNLTTLSAKVDPSHGRQLRELKFHLGVSIAKVQTANEECRLLIRHCLRLVQNALGYFQHWMEKPDVYCASGNIRAATGNGRLMSGMV